MNINLKDFEKLKVLQNNILVEVSSNMDTIYLDNDRCLYLVLESSKDFVNTYVRIVKIGEKVKDFSVNMWVWVNHYHLRCALGTVEHPDPRLIQCDGKTYAIIDATHVYAIEKNNIITPVNSRCFVTPTSEKIKTTLEIPDSIKNLKVKMTCRVLSLGLMTKEEKLSGFDRMKIGDIVIIRPNSYIEIDPTIYKSATRNILSDIDIEDDESLWSVPYCDIHAIVPSEFCISRIRKPKNRIIV